MGNINKYSNLYNKDNEFEFEFHSVIYNKYNIIYLFTSSLVCNF